MDATAKAAALTAEDEMQDVLAARMLLYATFRALFGDEPSVSRMACLDESLVRQAAQLVGASLPSEFSDLLASSGDQVDRLKTEYLRLFIGPGELPVPPWESVQRGFGGALFQPSTLEVRNAYRAHGFLPEGYPRVADDHVALELDYLCALAQRMAEAQAARDTSAACEDARASLEFLRDHLLRWVDTFASGLLSYGKSEFYATAAQALAHFVRTDAALLERMVNR